MNEFSILIRNMDRFLTSKLCAKEAEVDEEVHQERILKHRRRNVIMYEYLKMGAPGCQQRIERCSVLTANSVIKQAETNSSQAVGVTAKNFTLSLPLNYGGMMLIAQETISMGKTKF